MAELQAYTILIQACKLYLHKLTKKLWSLDPVVGIAAHIFTEKHNAFASNFKTTHLQEEVVKGHNGTDLKAKEKWEKKQHRRSNEKKKNQ